MTEYIKLVDDNLQSRNGYQWTISKRHRATGERGRGLCSDEYLHVYESGPVAALMAPAHDIEGYRRALVVEGVMADNDGTKVGLRQATALREIDRPTLTQEQRVAIAVVCAFRAYRNKNKQWLGWARRWLSGRDRSAMPSAPSWAAGWAAWAVRSTADGINLVEICDLVLSTPEDEWEGLVDDE